MVPTLIQQPGSAAARLRAVDGTHVGPRLTACPAAATARGTRVPAAAALAVPAVLPVLDAALVAFPPPRGAPPV